MSFNQLSPGSSDSGNGNSELRTNLVNNSISNNEARYSRNNNARESLPTQRHLSEYHHDNFHLLGSSSMSGALLPFQYHEQPLQELHYISHPQSNQFLPSHPSPSNSSLGLSSQKSIDYSLDPPFESKEKNPGKKKRPRRKFHEVERIYVCNFSNCTKAYGTLNHLNSHIFMQGHGPKRVPEEFKGIREERRQERKRQKQEAKKALKMATTGKQKSHSVGTIPVSSSFASSSSTPISDRVFQTSVTQLIDYQTHISRGFQNPSGEGKSYSISKTLQEPLRRLQNRSSTSDSTEEYAGMISNTTFVPANYNIGLTNSSSVHNNQIGDTGRHSVHHLHQLHPQSQHQYQYQHQQVKLPVLQEYQELPLSQQSLSQLQMPTQQQGRNPYFTPVEDIATHSYQEHEKSDSPKGYRYQ